MPISSGWDISQEEIRRIPGFLTLFLRRPIEQIAHIPEWHWPTIAVLWVAMLMVSGALTGFFTRRLGDFLAGLLVLPISGLIMAGIVTAFLFYTYQIFLNRELSFRKLYLLVVLSAFPYITLRVLTTFLPPADILGLALTSALLIVGLVENFALPRPFTMRLIGSVFAVFLCFWIYSQIQQAQYSSRPRMEITPDSFETLEKELKQTE